MKGNLNIGTYLGIPVKIHWTFGLLIIFVGYVGVTNGLDKGEIVAFGLYMMVLFLCVVFHEYGHAIMARKYGVKTKDIILSPIGGVARLESIPKEPYKELFIALAGPMVNVIIAVTLSIITISLYNGGILPSSESLELLKYPSEFIRFVIVMNVALFIFNLIPAFPMDGGRVLRSLLAFKIGRKRATIIASIIGRILAIGFIILGLFNSYLLLTIIGVFIYVTAGSENRSVMMSDLLEKTPVSKILNTHYTPIGLNENMDVPIEIFMRGGEKNFIVINELDGSVVGSLPELFLLDTIKKGTMELKVFQVMSSMNKSINDKSTMMEAYNIMTQDGLAILSVVNDYGQMVGVIDRAAISRFLDISFRNMDKKKSRAII